VRWVSSGGNAYLCSGIPAGYYEQVSTLYLEDSMYVNY
jgi:hypothetical protein